MASISSMTTKYALYYASTRRVTPRSRTPGPEALYSPKHAERVRRFDLLYLCVNRALSWWGLLPLLCAAIHRLSRCLRTAAGAMHSCSSVRGICIDLLCPLRSRLGWSRRHGRSYFMFSALNR